MFDDPSTVDAEAAGDHSCIHETTLALCGRFPTQQFAHAGSECLCVARRDAPRLSLPAWFLAGPVTFFVWSRVS
jgi:hypothetical protein